MTTILDNTTKTIYVSSPEEAVNKARKIFREDPTIEWVIATGEGTVGGLYHFPDDLIMHRSEKAAYTAGRTIEETKEYLLQGK